MRKSKISKVAVSVAVVTGFSVATRFISFLFKIYVSRTLGAEAIGLYQMALSVYLLLLSFAASGLPVVLSRKIAEDIALDNKKSSNYLTAGLSICLSIALSLVFTFYVLKKPISKLFSDERAVELLYIMLPALISTTTYMALRSWFWGQKKFAAFSFSELLEEIFRVIFTVLFTSGIITAIAPIKGLAIGFLISDFACVLILFIIFYKQKGRIAQPLGAKDLLISSTPITAMKSFGGLMTSLIALVIPAMLVANGLSTSESTATFGRVSGMAMPLLMAPTTLTGALAVVLIPEIAAASTKNDEIYLRARIEGSLTFSIFIASFFCILFLPLGIETSEIVFDDTQAGLFLSNSAILLYPIGLNQISLSMLNSLGMEKKSFINYFIGTLTLLLSIFIFPRYIGVYAIAVGTGICFTITSILNIRLLSKRVTLFDKPKKLILTVCLMPPCVAVAYLLKFLLLPVLPKFIGVVLSGGIPMAIYLGLAAAFDIIDVSRFYHRGKKSAKKWDKVKKSTQD